MLLTNFSFIIAHFIKFLAWNIILLSTIYYIKMVAATSIFSIVNWQNYLFFLTPTLMLRLYCVPTFLTQKYNLNLQFPPAHNSHLFLFFYSLSLLPLDPRLDSTLVGRGCQILSEENWSQVETKRFPKYIS